MKTFSQKMDALTKQQELDELTKKRNKKTIDDERMFARTYKIETENELIKAFERARKYHNWEEFCKERAYIIVAGWKVIENILKMSGTETEAELIELAVELGSSIDSQFKTSGYGAFKATESAAKYIILDFVSCFLATKENLYGGRPGALTIEQVRAEREKSMREFKENEKNKQWSCKNIRFVERGSGNTSDPESDFERGVGDWDSNFC